jgi:hypothetical protein
VSCAADNGGPAFPNDGHDNGPGNIRGRPAIGMSLRDYFAAKAMHAELVTCGVPGKAVDSMISRAKALGVNPIRHIANNAYEMADAMLAAREAHS